MAEPLSHVHHYVPQWYQRRFLPDGQSKLYYLDLKPETIFSGRVKHTRRALRCLGPAHCFCVEDLYSMRFGKATSDAMEKVLFGNIDRDGAAAVDFFNAYDDYKDGIHEAFKAIVEYMGAQRFRTPRGLDWIKRQSGTPDHTRTLMVMGELFQIYSAMWMEGIWEIVHARDSAAKFIISDEPVTFFNRLIFPGEAPYPGGDDFPKIGTRTIFPLGPASCLIITHLQLVRNLHHKPLALRENARMFGKTMFDLTDIQFGRELQADEVLRINHILKLCSTRFIASGDRGALYPEIHLAKPNWAKLDDDWFLLPNPWKVDFTTGLIMGFNDGRSLAVDEYGRDPRHPQYEEKKRQNTEFQTFESGKREWAKQRRGKALSRVINQMKENSFSDEMMNEYLRDQGLLTPEISAHE